MAAENRQAEDFVFSQTTVDDIVAAAGASRRTFFRYFESKRDLIAQPVASYAATLAEAIASCPGRAQRAEFVPVRGAGSRGEDRHRAAHAPGDGGRGEVPVGAGSAVGAGG